MMDSQVRKLDMFQRRDAFAKLNAADYAPSTPLVTVNSKIASVIAEIQAMVARQISGFDDASQAHAIKDDAEEDLRDMLELVSFGAKSFADEILGVEDKFRLPRGSGEQLLLAKARSFHTDAVPIEDKFIEAGLPADFLARLLALIGAFETAAAAADTATAKHSEATGALADAFRRGMVLSRKQDNLMKIRYRDNPGKMASFVVASHLERAPQKDKTP